VTGSAALIAAASTDASADDRYWDNLPDAVHVLQLSLPAGAHDATISFFAQGAPAVAMSLVRSAEKAVRGWGFTPEVVGGHALAGSAFISVCFDIVSSGARPNNDCAWTPPGAKSALRETDAFALAPATRLETDVVGHTL